MLIFFKKLYMELALIIFIVIICLNIWFYYKFGLKKFLYTMQSHVRSRLKKLHSIFCDVYSYRFKSNLLNLFSIFLIIIGVILIIIVY